MGDPKKIFTLHSSPPPDGPDQYKFTITYTDDQVDTIQAEYFGTSIDNANFILFGNGDMDETPPTLIKVDLIKKIETIKL